MESEHIQHIGIYRNAIDKEFCNEILKFYNTHQIHACSRQDLFGTSVLRQKDAQMILPDTRMVEGTEFHNKFASNFYENIYPEYVRNYPEIEHSGTNYLRFFKMQETEPSGGYHDWHYEYTHQYTTRVAVWTLYLNDNFEAGETEFLHQQYRLKPETGTVCIFPASYTHVHRGNPPIGGTKYIATGWLEL